MTYRTLSTEFRLFWAGVLLMWAQRILPQPPANPDHADHTPLWDAHQGITAALSSMEKLRD